MLKVNQLYKSYKTGSKTYPVLKNISFEINKGEFVAIMGSSGSGKTTLLNCISCFIPIDNGEIILGNNNIRNLKEKELSEVRNQQLGFVFQDFMLFDGLSVFENLCELFGIEHIRKKYPAEISGGEKQRTAVARALMNNPDLILADEPTGNLDSKSCRTVIESFLKAKQELDATILMVTHDSFAASFCDRVIVLKDGIIYKEVVKSNSRHKFLDELLEVLKQLINYTVNFEPIIGRTIQLYSFV